VFLKSRIATRLGQVDGESPLIRFRFVIGWSGVERKFPMVPSENFQENFYGDIFIPEAFLPQSHATA